ncbi:MAG: O-antigen ligase family protein [Verrucomicrobiota bacterium]
MPAVFSSAFLVIALILAVVIGPQTRPWTWGPALLALGIAMMAALPEFLRKSKKPAEFGLLAYALLVAGWFAWRTMISPVPELGEADLMLLAATVGTFVSLRSIEGNRLAERILVWGIALLLLANVVVIGKQMSDPTFSPVFRSRASLFPSGFYAHYNEAANYLIASSLLVAAAALFGREGRVTRGIWILIAIMGAAAVYFTRSRGGILGMAVGTGVFAVAGLVVAKRAGSRWFAPALVAVPVAGLAIAMFLLYGWSGSQEARNAESGVAQVLDSNYRLYFLGIAVSCIGLHPLAGGGSRSFSWESYRFYDVGLQGPAITRKAEQVHNELLQAATDYGLIGAGLLTILLAALVVIAVIRILFSDDPRAADSGDAWRLGGLAALAGMFVQSCFSFVFHLLPGVVLLGLCLGQLSRTPGGGTRTTGAIGSKIVLSLALIASVIILIPLGWKGTRVTRILWPTHFSKIPSMSAESRIDALTDAINLWPQSTFHQERAAIFQNIAAQGTGAEADKAAADAINDNTRAAALHPHEPEIAVNLANLLSMEQRDSEAETAYERAIQLQGGMEPAFQAHLCLANHLMRKGARQFDKNDPSPALATLEVAAQQMEQSVKEMRWASPDITQPRVTVHESLGAAREANGDYPGAMAAYDFAVTLAGGNRVHYRAGILFGKMAAASWAARRPAEALAYFIEAKKRIEMTGELPTDITPSQRVEYLTYLDQTITFLKGAKIEPLPLPRP